MNQSDLINSLNQLVSEERNSDTLDIDCLPTLEVVEKINQQDHFVSQAINKILPDVAEAVDLIVSAFNNGGRLVYLGAGTSGRLGVLDAVECVPTFGVSDDFVVAVMAGGESAMFKSKEGVEDDEKSGEQDLIQIKFKQQDILVGIAASGRTPYVIGGLKYAKNLGAKTIALSCNPSAIISKHCDVSLLPIVGAEVITGSTRMKSGTAQKMLLNMLSTASMIRIGKTYQNLMVDVKTTNQKLIARAIRIIIQVTQSSEADAESTLAKAGNNVKLAILMLRLNINIVEAKKCLKDNNGFLRNALEQ